MMTEDKIYPGIDPRLADYVAQEILPLYDHFDRAHQRDHALSVIDESMKLAALYEVDRNMVYAIAALHDIGLQADRATHHLVSGRLIRQNPFLPTLFSPHQIETMAQAAEDHRASSTHLPRSTYGLIVAEADRCISPHTIVRRTIEYSLSHFPQYDKETHYQRFLEHMAEKYAEGGYLRLYIPQSDNARRLKAFQTLLKDEAATRRLFEEEWEGKRT